MNKQLVKNIVMIVLIVALGCAMVFTSGIVGHKGGDGNAPGGQPPQMQSQSTSDSDSDAQNSDDSDANSDSSADNNSESNDKNADNSSDSNADKGQPPAKPDGDNGDAPSGEPPEMPDNAEGGQPPQMQGDGNMGGQPGGISAVKIALTGAEALAFALLLVYLLMSGFNRKTFKETLFGKKVAIFVIVSVLGGAALTAACTFVPMKLMTPDMPEQIQMNDDGSMDQSTDSTTESSTDATSEEN